MKFKKKPIVIEAYQTAEALKIPTLEGVMLASPGDWIITGVNGEQYPCKPDIFEKTYSEASEDDVVTDLSRVQFDRIESKLEDGEFKLIFVFKS